MDELRVRIYNVLFGDAILISVPDKDRDGGSIVRHILIDLGNVMGGEGGQDKVFKPVIENILEELDGRPLDLYVMTHEHMDHVQGPLYVNEEILPDHDLKRRLRVQHAWLTASSAPDYYETHAEARRKLDDARSAYKEIYKLLAASPELLSDTARTLLAINNPWSTSDCVDFIRTLADHTWYVHRQTDLTGKHPFRDVRFEVWAPEEDTSIYYGRFRPVNLGVGLEEDGGTRKLVLSATRPPPGVDAGTFFNLVERRRSGYMDNLMAIDKAANNTSLVLLLEWRGWRLLFLGDAELRSWKEMERQNVLKPVHFMKVSHHGSPTGTPSSEILDKVLAIAPSDDRPRHSAVSTFRGTYDGVPDPNALTELGRRCELIDASNKPEGGYVDITFQG